MKIIIQALFLLLSSIITHQMIASSYDASAYVYTELHSHQALARLKKALQLKLSSQQEEALLAIFKEGRILIAGTDLEEVRGQILNGDYSCFITEYENRYREKKQKELKKEFDKAKKEYDKLKEDEEAAEEEEQAERFAQKQKNKRELKKDLEEEKSAKPSFGFATFQPFNPTDQNMTSKKSAERKGDRSFGDLTQLFDSLPPLSE